MAAPESNEMPSTRVGGLANEQQSAGEGVVNSPASNWSVDGWDADEPSYDVYPWGI
jgi:hypothetical protein